MSGFSDNMREGTNEKGVDLIYLYKYIKRDN